LSHQIHDQHAEINYLIELGMINRRLGNYTEAGQCYKKAYDLNRILAQPQLSAIINNNWAGLYIELGDWQNALDFQIRALQDEPHPQAHLLAVRLSNIGFIYSMLNNHPKALDYQKRALHELGKNHSFASEKALIYLRMGDVYRKLGQRNEAESSYQTALSIAEHTKEILTQILALLGLGNLHNESGEFDRALSLQNQALKLAQQTKSPDLEWNAAFALGRTYEALNEIDLAQRAYEDALEKVEASRTKISADTLRMSFFAIKQDVYDSMTELHLELRNDPETALHYSERSRARIMLDIMDERFHQAAFVCNIPQLAELQRLMTTDMILSNINCCPIS
jgi:tetratricopeptide (TPR) repeat protein